ncbi:L-proline dehydrogenase / delta-1-pyrroline-5-carboxylate dehydrogenase [Pararhodospirillum photometricum DSM 122]|uniref:L-proline dehydrogenase / delta-1-pyrroline-5-carboxylate dehydrogenase n=1 Tax=Pararhodospirillum photometricum DSM 122 TaxID=1150469 RepID=H6SLN8_PARPM|nr:L-proline dehydrogenase / delta-1-pyrroline-5-carboxylate dehydrogenase [Pararhodospirillum photometricum DSM 122]
MPGPTGESNRLALWGRGLVACLGADARAQALVALAAGNAVLVERPLGLEDHPVVGPLIVVGRVDLEGTELALVVCDGPEVPTLRRILAERPGARVPLVSLTDGLGRFVCERVVSIDTTASGGNASLLMLKED